MINGIPSRLGMRLLAAAACGAGVIAGSGMATAVALADPQNVPPGQPVNQNVPPAPPEQPVNQAASGDPSASLVPLNGMPHLSSPDNLPPGTTDSGPPESSNLSYLREIWHAVQDHDISMSDAMLLFAQRPMDSAPPPGMDVNPQPPPAGPPPAPAP
jgi:hypothetical protein